ncbi:MAG TPA: hypothetical protein VF346_06890 [Bacteroidales bacterium]
MDRWIVKKSTGTLFLLAIIYVSGCTKQVPEEYGYLEGVINIGPICPVEKIPPDPSCLPTAETYKAYPVDVFTSDMKRKITLLNPSLDGAFSSKLPPGNYLIVLETAKNKIGGSNLPANVSISSQEKTLLNIDIDTGIR